MARLAAAEQTGGVVIALDENHHVSGKSIAAAAGLPGDADHQFEPGLGLDELALLHGCVGSILNDRVNGPLRLTDEPGFHGHGEVRTSAFVRHGGTVQPARSGRYVIKE